MRKALFLFGLLDDGDIEWMIAAGRRQRIPTGTVLIAEGRDIDNLFIVLDGTFSVRASALGGKEVARLRVGEVLGEMSFLDARPPSATVIALEDSLVLTIPRAALSGRLKEEGFASRFYHSLGVFLANRLRNTVARLGYGKTASEMSPFDSEDEIGPTVLENLTLAGARCDWMIKRLKDG